MLTEKDLRAIIRKRRGAGKWIEYQGPMAIGTVEIYEIWTTTKGDRVEGIFWLEDEKGHKSKVFTSNTIHRRR